MHSSRDIFPAALLALGALAASGAGQAQERADLRALSAGAPAGQSNFARIATFANYQNNAELADETVSEIVSVTANGRTLVYTDGALGRIGFVDIGNPYAPAPAGSLELGGEPTSVSVLGNRLALVGVNTSESFTDPSGDLVVVDINQRSVLATFALGGQPDSLDISPDGKYAAIAIENERDEDITVDGIEGGLPQSPPGYLVIVDIKGNNPANWGLRRVELTGIAGYVPEDPEPEFVDINAENEAVITLQENNEVIIVDLAAGKVTGNFPLGSVTLNNIDATEDDNIVLAETLVDVEREPDAVAWVCRNGTGNYYRQNCLIATANEGDLFGGSRGFSLFDRMGNVKFDSGNSYDQLAVRAGHYPEGRSENKGSEPESIEYAEFDGKKYLFVGSERGSFIAVYQLVRGKPRLRQILPAPLGPEGLLAIPSRNLLIASGEEDDPEFGVRSTMMIYKLRDGKPTYPQVVSADDEQGKPIPWSAMSGMTTAPGYGNRLLAVWDSFYAESKIFTLDTSARPARITDAITIRGGSGNYDPEGIAVAPDGTYWIASEGNADGSRPNRLLQTDTAGNVIREIGLPAEIEACRAASANTGSLGAGFEGVAVKPTRDGYKLLVAQQRGWDYTTPECEDLDDDPAGANAGEPAQTRIWVYNPANNNWDSIAWELAPVPANASWVGLSEISSNPSGGFIVIERDNRTGDFAELKTLVNFRWSAVQDGIVSAADKQVYDLIPDMLATNGWISDKPEGVGIANNGRVFVITDNDGVDDWSGETQFLRLGKVWPLFNN